MTEQDDRNQQVSDQMDRTDDSVEALATEVGKLRPEVEKLNGNVSKVSHRQRVGFWALGLAVAALAIVLGLAAFFFVEYRADQRQSRVEACERGNALRAASIDAFNKAGETLRPQPVSDPTPEDLRQAERGNQRVDEALEVINDTEGLQPVDCSGL